MAKKSVAEIIVTTLLAAGAKRVYGTAGESLGSLLEVLRTHEELAFIEVRHEEAAAFAAGGEANITGHLAVCVGSCGPGNVQMLNGLYDCQRSGLPVLAIATQVPSDEIGSGFFQETNPELLFAECSHYCESISVPGQAVRVTEAAVQAALGKGGVGVIIVPADVAALKVEAPRPLLPTLGHHSAIVPASDKVAQAAQLLNECEKITILAGSGIEGAHPELLQAAQTLQAPVVHSLRGKECVEPNNPFGVGLTGELGLPAAQQALLEADGILMLGTDLPFRQFFPAGARVVQIDKRLSHIGRRTRVEVGLHGTPAEALQKLLPQLRTRANPAHLQAAQQQHQADEQELAEQAALVPGPLRPQQIACLLSNLAADDAIFTCDIGTPLIWAGRYLHMNGRRRLINSFVHGSSGSALPQAIGATLAAPGRQVVALCGDGGFAVLLGELLTVHQAQLPIKIIILNNSGHRATELAQHASGAPAFGTRLVNPDFSQLAVAVGVHGRRVSDPTQLEAVLRETLAYPGPVVVDALVSHEELSRPPLQVGGQAQEGSFSSVKALVSEGSALLEKAKAELFGKGQPSTKAD